MITVEQLIEEVAEAFSAAPLHFGHGTDNPWDEAVFLVTQTLDLPDDRAVLAQVVTEPNCQRVRVLAETRIHTRKPLAYLLQRATYVGMELAVPEGVVIPRSPIGPWLADTAGAGDDGLSAWLQQTPRRVLDLCAGSGALGLLAAHLFPESEVTLVELDTLALETSVANIEAYGLSARVRAVQADVFKPWPLQGRFDLILSNPPYVDDPDMRSLPEEYRFEPSAGLASGRDGLGHIQAILQQLPHFLHPHGVFVGEVGQSSRALQQQMDHLPIIWLELPRGGEGVFLLEGRSLVHHTAPAN